MKLDRKSGAKIAMTATALLVSGALIGSAQAVELKGRCFGVNGCAGKGACKSAKNDCKGKNACKGEGWIAMLKADCESQGGQFEAS
jgi:hypothetical protein